METSAWPGKAKENVLDSTHCRKMSKKKNNEDINDRLKFIKEEVLKDSEISKEIYSIHKNGDIKHMLFLDYKFINEKKHFYLTEISWNESVLKNKEEVKSEVLFVSDDPIVDDNPRKSFSFIKTKKVIEEKINHLKDLGYELEYPDQKKIDKILLLFDESYRPKAEDNLKIDSIETDLTQPFILPVAREFRGLDGICKMVMEKKHFDYKCDAIQCDWKNKLYEYVEYEINWDEWKETSVVKGLNLVENTCRIMSQFDKIVSFRLRKFLDTNNWAQEIQAYPIKKFFGHITANLEQCDKDAQFIIVGNMVFVHDEDEIVIYSPAIKSFVQNPSINHRWVLDEQTEANTIVLMGDYFDLKKRIKI